MVVGLVFDLCHGIRSRGLHSIQARLSSTWPRSFDCPTRRGQLYGSPGTRLAGGPGLLQWALATIPPRAACPGAFQVQASGTALQRHADPDHAGGRDVDGVGHGERRVADRRRARLRRPGRVRLGGNRAPSIAGGVLGTLRHLGDDWGWSNSGPQGQPVWTGLGVGALAVARARSAAGDRCGFGIPPRLDCSQC
jgi:hypothetical protein